MSIVTIRPTGVAYTSYAIVTTGAVNAQTAVSDNSDSSYTQASTGGTHGSSADDQRSRFTLADISLTASQRVRSCQLRIRNSCTSVIDQSTQDTIIRMVGPSGPPPETGTFLSQRSTTAIVTYAGPVAYNAPGPTAWTQANVNSLLLEVQWEQTHAGQFMLFQRVYELYCDVDVNNQPVVSGVGAINTTASTPTIQWTYTDVDGDGQVAWRVKVFTAAQVAAPGFSAGTTTPIWDSTQMTGTANSVVTGNLVQDSYVAYVQAAQSWPGLAGSLWWSAWATSNFSVAFVAPYAPVIQSAAVVQDGNQYRTVLSVLAPVNLLTNDNSDFESSVGQWTALANCAVIRDTAQFANGIASMKMTSTAAGDMTAQCALDIIGEPHVDGGQTYTIVANFRANSSTRSCAVGVQWLDSSNANIGAVSYGGNVTDSAANFSAQATFTGAAPGNARSAKVTVKVVGTGAGSEIHWVDKVDIHAGSTVGWMPGGYSNNVGGLILQRGEYIDDRPGAISNWMHPQVASAGSSQRTAGFGFWWDTTASSLSWKWLDKTISTPGSTPPGMLDWAPQTATASTIILGIYIYGGSAYLTPCIANQAHTGSCWAWTNTTTQTVAIRIRWYDGTGTFISSSSNVNFTLTTTPQRLSTTATAPSNAMLAAIELVNVNSDNTRHFYVTRIGLGLGSVTVGGQQALGLDNGKTAVGAPIGPLWTNTRFAADGSLSGSQTLVGFPEAYSMGQVDTIADYEYPPGRPALYRAYITYTYASTSIVSAYSNYVMVYNAPPAVTLLRSTTTPTLQVVVNRRKDAAYSPSDDAQVFHPLGADAAPIRIRDWASGADGNLTIITSTDAQAARLNALVLSNDVLEIQWAQGGRTYCFITDRQIAEILSSDIDFCDADGTQPYLRYRVWTIAYMETVAP